MPYYIPDLVGKSTCVGNTLSTFNISFSSLDTKLHELSVYSTSSINYLSSTMVSVSSTLNNRISYLSSTMVSVSSNLQTQLNQTSSFLFSSIETQTDYLSTQTQYLSTNTVKNYVQQGILSSINNIVDWNFLTQGNNAKLTLTASAMLNNPTELYAGQSGNLMVQIANSGVTLSSYGTLWTFTGNFSSFSPMASSKNLISYYYDGQQLLSNLISFSI